MGIFNKIKKKAFAATPLHLYSEQELEQYEKFITEQFGEYKEVLHEIVSLNGIHLDIIIVPPTESNNYYKLITMGMGHIK